MRLVAGLTLWGWGVKLDPWPVHVKFMVKKWHCDSFFPVLRCYSVTVIPPVHHIHPLLRAALTTRKNGRSLGTS